MTSTSLHTAKQYITSPVIIGGVGGSGTRMVLRALQIAGLQTGAYLNPSLDNIHFSFAVQFDPKVITWSHERLGPYLDLFTTLQFGSGWTPGTVMRLLQVTAKNSSMLKPLFGTVRDARHIYLRSRRLRIPLHGDMPWGWKSPRTQLLLQPLHAHFPECRYIHVMRHGLDMAFSRNLNQLRLFGWNFNIDPNVDLEKIPVVQLDYWIRSTQHALDYCKTRLPNQHFILNYDQLCTEPMSVLPDLLNFARLPQDAETLAQIRTEITPTTQGRYREKDLSIFSDEQLAAVARLGFPV